MSLNTVDPTTGQTTKIAGVFDISPIEEITEQLTANNVPFRFGYDSNTGKYGYILNEGGADTVIPFKDCDSSEVTVTAANQILSGYKDYDANGIIITGTNAGYDAGMTQGHSDRDSGVTVTEASQVLSGYKARTSSGTLVTGTATTNPTFSTETITIPVPSSGQDRWKTLTGSFSFANECLGIIECKNPDGAHNKCLQSVKLSGTKNNTCTIVMDTVYSHYDFNWSVTAKGY